MRSKIFHNNRPINSTRRWRHIHRSRSAHSDCHRIFLVARRTHRAASACDRLISLRSCSNSQSNSRTRCRTGTVNNNVGSRWDDARPILSPHLLRRNASRLRRANMQRQRRAWFVELKKFILRCSVLCDCNCCCPTNASHLRNAHRDIRAVTPSSFPR